MKLAQVAVALSFATAAYGKGPSMKLVATVADVSGREAAFAPDGHHWAVGDGVRLHVGHDGALDRSVAAPGTPRGPIAFGANGAQIRWGATLTSGDQAIQDPAAEVALKSALPASPGGIELFFVATTADGAITAAVGRTRPAARLHGPGGVQKAALVLVGAAQPVVWSGAITDAPARLLVTQRVLVAAGTGVLVADVHTGKVVAANDRVFGGTVNALVADEHAFYTAAADGSVAAWDLATGAKRWSVALSHEPLRALALSHGALVVTGWDDRLRVLSPVDGKQREELALGSHGEALAISADGARLLVALGGARGELRLYELAR